MEPEQADGDLPSAQQVRGALERSKLTWGWRNTITGNNMFLHVNNEPGTVNYELHANTHYLSPADMEAFLRGLEAVLVEAALRPL